MSENKCERCGLLIFEPANHVKCVESKVPTLTEQMDADEAAGLAAQIQRNEAKANTLHTTEVTGNPPPPPADVAVPAITIKNIDADLARPHRRASARLTALAERVDTLERNSDFHTEGRLRGLEEAHNAGLTALVDRMDALGVRHDSLEDEVENNSSKIGGLTEAAFAQDEYAQESRRRIKALEGPKHKVGLGYDPLPPMPSTSEDDPDTYSDGTLVVSHAELNRLSNIVPPQAMAVIEAARYVTPKSRDRVQEHMTVEDGERLFDALAAFDAAMADGTIHNKTLFEMNDAWKRLDSIMGEYGLDNKAQPEEAQAWLRERLSALEPTEIERMLDECVSNLIRAAPVSSGCSWEHSEDTWKAWRLERGIGGEE